MLSATLSLFRRFILRDLHKNYVRTSLTVFGIALGVAVLLAISLANHTALAKFRETVDLVAGKANLEIRPLGAPAMDERVLYGLQWLWQSGAKFSPLIEENVVFGGKDGPLVQLIGMDMLADDEFKTYDQASSSDSDSAAGKAIDVLSPHAALVGARLAHDEHLVAGQEFQLLVNERPFKLIVAKVLSGKGLGGAFSGNMLVTDIRTAQQACGLSGKISRVELIVPENDFAAVREKLSHDLAPLLAVERPSQRGAQVERMTRSFEYNLLALTFIALMVGMFLIYNTMTISVIRRRAEIGTLRALGCSRWQILQLFCLEAITFGAAGTAFGIAGGIAAAQGALNAIAQTFEHFYFKEPLETVMVNPPIVCAAFLIGVGATVAASIMPAMEAANVAPAEATRRASYELKASSRAGRLAVFGALFLVGAAVCSVQPALWGFPCFGYAAALFTILGAALVTPLALRCTLPLVACAAEPIFGAEARLAARSLLGTLGRTSIALASLAIGIAMMVSLAIMIGSFRQTVMMWVDQTLKADLWVQTSARYGGNKNARISPQTVQLIRSTPGVAAVDAFVEHAIDYNGERTNLGAGDLDVIAKYGHLLFTSGEPGAVVCARVGDGDAIVSEAFAIRKNVKQGDIIRVVTAAGEIPFRIQGVYYDYASDLGYIVISRRTYSRIYHDHSASSCAVYVTPGANLESVRSLILKGAGNDANLRARTTGELRLQALKVFDRTFSITYALHTIAIAVALLSVMNALFALTMESRREFAILRYIGASERQLRRIVLVEAGILGALGNLGGLALGGVLSLLLIYVINRQSFGWTVQFMVPFDFLLQSAVLVFATALLAGLVPARIAANTLAPSAVRDE